MPKIFPTTVKKVIVQQGGGSTGEVDDERLQYDNRNTNRRSIEAPPMIAAVIAEMNRRSIDTVTAAVLGQALEVNKRAVEDVSNTVTAIVLDAQHKASDTTMIAIASLEVGKRAVDAATAIVVPTADLAKRAVETTPLSVTATVMDVAKRAVETIQAAIIAATDFAKRALDTATASVSYAGYANANVSTTTWTVPANFLGNTTGTSALLTATSSGLAGLTSNTSTGIIDVGFADPQITDLPITSAIMINLERAIVSSGTLPLGQAVNMLWQYSLDAGGSWTNLQAADTGAVAKSIISLTLGGVMADYVNLDDSSGNSRTLTKTGVATPVTSPWSGFGGAAQFASGGANYLSLSGASAAIFSSTGARNRTYDVKFKALAGSDGTIRILMGVLLSGAGNLAPEWYLVVDSSNILTFAVKNNAGTTLTMSGGLVAVDQLNTARVSNVGASYYLFLNGALTATMSATVGSTETTAEFRINSTAAGNASQNILVDEVRVSSVARSTASYTVDTSPFVNDASTLALWHLDTVSGGGGSSITYAQLNNLRVRGNGSVTSGAGLSAQMQAQAFRTWVTFAASKGY